MAGGVRAVPQDAEAWQMREVEPWPAWMRFEDAAVPAGDGAHVRLVRPDPVRSGVGHPWAAV